LAYQKCNNITQLTELLSKQPYAKQPRLIELEFEPNQNKRYQQTFKQLLLR
jgi:hypothetical protein